MIISDRILSCTKSLSDYLQQIKINLAKAVDLVSASESTLQLFRTDEAWERLFTYAKDVARVKEINVGDICTSRTRMFPQHFQDGIVCISTGSREPLSTSEQYKINLYFQLLMLCLMSLKLDSIKTILS